MMVTTAFPTNEFLSSLDRESRLVLMLHFADELTVEETAHVLRVPLARIEAIVDDLRALAARQLSGLGPVAGDAAVA